MKGFLVFCAVLFLFFGISVLVHLQSSPANQTASNDQSSFSAERTENVPVLKTSVPELYFAYQENEVAADNKYKGRRLYLDGIVGSINKDIWDNVYLTLPARGNFMGIDATLSADSERAAADLQRGMMVSMECNGAGMFATIVKLDKCSFVQHKEPLPSVVSPEPVIPNANQSTDVSSSQMRENASDTDSPSDNAVKRIGGDVMAPKLIYAPEPEFSDDARTKKIGGDVIVDLAVDTQGMPQNIHVVRGVGMGLDEKAIEAVQKYRFKPATQNGKPVIVEMQVSVNFQIF